MQSPERLREIAALLRELVAASPGSAAELPGWDVASNRINRCLRTEYRDIVLPVQVMHYLHDGDIRAKDSTYAAMQGRVMLELITDLERGELPRSRGATVSVSFSSAIVLAACLGASLLFAAKACN